MDKKKNREEIKETTGISEKKNKNKKEKNYTLAGILALFFGGIGLHKFYLGDWKMGIIYALFMWTGIPGTIAFYEGAKYLMQ